MPLNEQYRSMAGRKQQINEVEKRDKAENMVGNGRRVADVKNSRAKKKEIFFIPPSPPIKNDFERAEGAYLFNRAGAGKRFSFAELP